jgi:tRNA-splicing ligase RtcB
MERIIHTLNRLDDYRWEIPVEYRYGMRVSGVIYASGEMIEAIIAEGAHEQLVNVSCLPGITGHALAMPDIHCGYGFPIGGVAATLAKGGVVSPGGVGYDINCGVRLLRTDLMMDEVRPRLEKLVHGLYRQIPSGLGSEGKISLTEDDLEGVMTQGAGWAVKHGYGTVSDLELTEDNGCMSGADPSKVSLRARIRGAKQAGTLGSGNHFIEVQAVSEIYDQNAAAVMGIHDIGQIMILIHTGSRGFGHQICDDYLRIMSHAVRSYEIEIPDRQLACAPLDSPEALDYLSAMACAANYAWANRQLIGQWVRDAFSGSFGASSEKLGIRQVYDVSHNIARIEQHLIAGESTMMCVHRKGATRSYPPGHSDLPAVYSGIGQPVFIPGDMGRYSYTAVGTQKAMHETFGSTCHGAGRLLGRGAARRKLSGLDVKRY